MAEKEIFYQLFESESSTYTYLLADPETREALIIDPVLKTVERDLQLVKETGVKLKFVLDTHVHADHITAADELRKRLGVKAAVSAGAKVACADINLRDGDEIIIGRLKLKALATPGHTDSCMSFYGQGKVFTGDALLIRGCGRTDFQQGSAERLYESVHAKLFSLPDDTSVYPGHDYRGQTHSTIELEKRFNPRLGGGKSLGEFIKIMSELKLDYPKNIQAALPANLGCGKVSPAEAT